MVGAGFDGAFGYAEALGGLADGLVEDVDLDEDGAVGGGEVCEGVAQDVAVEDLFEGLGGGGDAGEGFVFDFGGTSGAGAQRVYGQAAGDGQEPGADGARVVVEGVEVAPGAEHGFLHEVFGGLAVAFGPAHEGAQE